LKSKNILTTGLFLGLVLIFIVMATFGGNISETNYKAQFFMLCETRLNISADAPLYKKLLAAHNITDSKAWDQLGYKKIHPKADMADVWFTCQDFMGTHNWDDVK